MTLFKLLSAIRAEGLANESGCGGYFLFYPSSALITGEHVQEQIAKDELAEFHPECKQVYVLSVKADVLEDDREIIEIQVPLG